MAFPTRKCQAREVLPKHLNEDEYSIHLRDTKGDLRSFMKSELKEIKLPRESLMPDYASLSKVDLENLVGEIRVVDDQWYLDSFIQSGTESKALMNRTALHPLGSWRHVASVYDGREFRNYVDGVQEGSAQLRLAPHGPGHTSVGVRINKVFYFKGAVRLARFTPRALSPSEFLRSPARGQ